MAANEFPIYLLVKSDKHTVIFVDKFFSHYPSETNKLSQLKLMGIFIHPHRVRCQTEHMRVFRNGSSRSRKTVEAKQSILKLEKEGYSHGKKSEITEKNRRTDSKFLNKFSATVFIENCDRSGCRKRSTSQADSDGK